CPPSRSGLLTPRLIGNTPWSVRHALVHPGERRGHPMNGRACMMSPSHERKMSEIIRLTQRNFDEMLAATPSLAIVDFWAEWCGPCRMIAPVLEQVTEASEGKVVLMKVNVDESPGLAARYGIRSIPTMLFVKDGEVVDRVVGAVPKAVLEEHIERASHA